ncbi:MAG: carboxypeptidase-like regulatory domain-containing protein [Alphaproteobacteria bacterium]|nr:carboxypeptidase-like regulatory domain-containing protein [Alphaproteobacteria bacterium]
MKKIILSLLVLFMSLPAMAADETITISGTVRDATETLIGASISYTSANGTPTGTITDLDGKFTLQNVPSNATVTISYVGCTEQKYTASSIPSTITLNCETALNEVVVKACAPDKANGIAARELIDDECYPTKCIEPRWKLSGSDKSAKCIEQKCTFDNGTGEWTQNGDTWECKLTSCNTDKGYKKSTDETQCVKMLQKCTDEQLKEHPNASDTSIKAGTETCIATACKCGYKLDGEKCVAIPQNTPCDKADLPKYASAGIKACKNGNPYCKITACLNETEYKLDTEKNRCEYLKGETCTHTDTNAERAEWKNVDGKLVCTLKKCKDGFYVVDNKCEPSDGDCTAEQLKQIEHAIKGARKKDKCVPTECEPGFEPSGNECVDIAGKCETKPEYSKKSHREFVSGAEICKIDECEDGYSISSDGKKCEPSLDEKQARDKAKELRANADEMKRVEQSTENKLLGAAGMGAAGIGGMQVASALAEKNADEDAERDMAAYLATFRCDYGHGLNIKGGETGIELPGANSLIPLYQEYVNLANDLKVRKNALGMKPGIESEKILDAATSGLYDNQSIGKVDGAFTSLARALADPTGADAAEWAAQKDATAKKLKTGAVVAGIGILGSAVGNAIINRNVNEKSDEIKRKYENIVDIPKPTPLPTERKCSDSKGATGTYPECTCTDNTNYFAAEQGCIPCGTGQTFNTTTKKCECTDTNKQYNESENKCTCKSPMVENASGVCTNPQPPVSGCELTGLVTKDCKCVNGAAKVGNNCECRSGWYSPDNKTCAECKSAEHKVVVDNQCVCQAPYYSTNGNKTCTECKASDNKEIKDGKCQCREGYNPDSTTGKCERIPAPEPLIKISFGSDVLFETGSAKLANNGKTMLDEFNKRLEDAQKNSNNKFDLKTDTDYCISVTGHTDRTPFRGDQLKNAPTNPDNKNMKLSLQRANAVKDKLSEVANPANIWAQGLGENHCTAETYPARNDQRCRRVDIEFWTGSCESNKASATSGMLQSTVKGLAGNVGDQLIKNMTGDTKKN